MDQLSRFAEHNPITARRRSAKVVSDPAECDPCASVPSGLDAGGRSSDERQALRELMIAAANQLELWAAGQACDDFRREYLIELVSELRAEASDALADQLSLWGDDEEFEERRRLLVADLAEELRTRVPAGHAPALDDDDPAQSRD